MTVISGGDGSGGAIGIVVSGAGTSGTSPKATVALIGVAGCVFDSTPRTADYFQMSLTAPGQCHDSGPGYPSGVQVLGRVTDPSQSPPQVYLFGTEARGIRTDTLSNTAVGVSTLAANTSGFADTAVGANALVNNTGSANTAVGNQALQSNTTGFTNTAVGNQALQSNTGANGNTAVGSGALGNTTGGENIAIGHLAGNSLTSGSSNIYIGSNGGASSESNAIRIGVSQTATFIAGIFNQTSGSGTAVFVNSNGQLGTTTSSRRFKHEIADLGAESDLLMKLRPVAFYYKPELDDTQTRQYGLVAEEVAQVAPQLVVYDKDGAPQTVRYHFVNAMLLNEVQKQRSTIARQQAEIQDLAARLAKLEAATAGR